MTSVRILWLIIGLLWIAAEVRLARRAKPGQLAIVASERQSRRRLWLSVLLGLGLALLFKQLSWLPIPISYLPRQLLAMSLFAGGLGLRYWAVCQLGHFFTTHVTIQQQHCLIQTGPYRVIRHPAYTGLLLALTAAGLAMGDFLALTLLLLPNFLAFKSRIKLEEEMLRQSFSEAYEQYIDRSWRLIPGIF